VWRDERTQLRDARVVGTARAPDEDALADGEISFGKDGEAVTFDADSALEASVSAKPGLWRRAMIAMGFAKSDSIATIAVAVAPATSAPPTAPVTAATAVAEATVAETKA